MKTALRFFCILFFTLVSMQLRAAELSPKATVSLLIASPDTRQLVTCYGHTLLRVNDPESGIQESVRMPSTHNSWALQFRSLPQMKCRIFAEVRCDSSAPSGNALTLGIYNPELRREVFVKRIAAKEIAGKKYKTVCLGEFALPENAMLYFAPVINPSVSSIWIKRFILVEMK